MYTAILLIRSFLNLGIFMSDDIFKKLDEDLEKIHNKYNEKPPLYHYTIYEGLKGILESKTIWLSDYRCLNDPTEIHYALSILIDHIKIKSIQKTFKTKELWEKIIDKYPEFIKANDIYICSFCRQPDYLPAWRWYGDNGKGFAIGFRKEYFEPRETEDEDWKIFTKGVNYDKNDFIKMLDEMIKITEETVNSLGGDISVQNKNSIIVSFISWTYTALPGLKHGGYTHEEEFRLCTSEFEMNGKKYPHPIPEKNKFVRPVPPIKLRYPSFTQIPTVKSDPFDYEDICEIWVGPSLDYDDAKDKVEKILKDSGYDVKKVNIIKSQVPYRSY